MRAKRHLVQLSEPLTKTLDISRLTYTTMRAKRPLVQLSVFRSNFVTDPTIPLFPEGFSFYTYIPVSQEA
ncbi:hypothetical protein ES332_A03G129000v1 [Gossypium tomentosum]|uniref:Uncharacterized protein n=1 Tax=Gossypium tomentosum TaxID=34277 RepID=A0A5D2R5V1_GOSTO|nr:hypothetical protein ES332_A03G129000v1 [Gossypium tomentosum]